MNRLIKLAALLLVVVSVGACGTARSGMEYAEAVRLTERALMEAEERRELFGITKTTGRRSTQFDFVNGSRWSKVNHAFPLRIKTTVWSVDAGSGSSFKFRAQQHGLFGSRRDESAERRWREQIAGALSR